MISAIMHGRRVVAAVLFALVAGLAAAVPAAAAPKALAGVPVYALRGALGIFSSGMDSLADELNADGIAAASVAFNDWGDYDARIIAAYRKHPYPVVLIGHSWGANTILLMAYDLDRHNVPVAALIFYDITESARIPANVKWVVNYRSNSATGGNIQVVGGAGFTGKIKNITRADLNHVQIDKAPDLHRHTIAVVRAALGLPERR